MEAGQEAGPVKKKQKLMTVQFGKYKGWSFQGVLEKDPSYVDWALKNLITDTRQNQMDFVAYLKEHHQDVINPDYSQDPLLKDAWYLDSRAQVLVQHDLDPALPLQGCTSAVNYCSVEDISIEEYKSMLDQDLLRQHDVLDYEFELNFLTGDYFLKPEIVNAVMALHDKYMRNKAADEPYISSGTPSKVITRYWLSGRRMSAIGERVGTEQGQGTGKWTLFFDKMKENAEGLTELDICYRSLQENFASITSKHSFKVSTRRPNSNAAHSQTGVVVVYCNEDDRVEIFLQLAQLLSLKKGKYYWKYHTSRYAKDGVKASDFCYTLDADN